MKFSTAMLLFSLAASFFVLGYADDEVSSAPDAVTGAADGGAKAEEAVTGAADGASKPPAESSPSPSASPASGSSSLPPSAAPSVETTTKSASILAPLTSILFVFGMAR